MAKKKSSSGAAVAPVDYGALANYSNDAPWWPKEFASMRFAIMQVVVLAVLGFMLFILDIGLEVIGGAIGGSVGGALQEFARTEYLVMVKQIISWSIGSFNPLYLPDASSRDLAILIWCLVLVGGNALIHPSLGLVSLATLRPWLDGYTFKNDNVYFLWGAVLLLALWGVRTLMRNEPVRFPIITVFSAGYLIVALLLSPWSVHFGETYKQLLLWTGYVAVFVVTLQNLTTPRTQLFVLWAVLLGMALQAIFAVLQYHYVLPFLRHLINQDPSVLRRFFGVEHVTEEMRHRFNKNRAFGTVLFPNALAALLILGIPGCAVLLRNMLADAMPIWRNRAQIVPVVDKAHRRRALIVGGIVWFVGALGFFALTIIPTSYDPDSTGANYESPFYFNLVFLFFAAIVLGAIPAAGYFLAAVRHGFPFANRIVMLVGTATSEWWLLWALSLSYSRGGILALVVGSIIGAALYAAPPGATRRLRRLLPHAAAAVLILLAGATVVDSLLSTAEAQARVNTVTRQGENVSFADLANPESFALRLSYWRVGMGMFLDNFFTGVGLGSFKWAYPKYQYIGAGNVQEAHNSYLQAFTETGVLGGLVLMGFWLWLLAQAAVRISAEQNRPRKRLLAALFAGLVAFLIHAALDINFAHPTLMFFAMLFAGLLCVLSAGEGAPVAARSRMPILVGLLIGATFATGLSTRPWLQNLSLSRMQFIGGDAEDQLLRRFETASYVTINAPEAKANNAKVRPESIMLRDLEFFGMDLKPYVDQSRVFVPRNDGSGKYTVAPPGTPVDSKTRLVLLKQWATAKQMQQDVRPWMDSMVGEDARFPFDPQVSMHLSNWYQMLTYFPSNSIDEDYAAMRRWSDETIERNPLNADGYVNKSRSVIQEWNKNKDNIGLLDEAVYLREQACELAPSQHIFQYILADALKLLASSLEAKGDAAGAHEARQREAAARTRGWEILSHGMPQKDIDNPPPGMTGAVIPGAAPQAAQ